MGKKKKKNGKKKKKKNKSSLITTVDARLLAVREGTLATVTEENEPKGTTDGESSLDALIAECKRKLKKHKSKLLCSQNELDRSSQEMHEGTPEGRGLEPSTAGAALTSELGEELFEISPDVEEVCRARML